MEKNLICINCPQGCHLTINTASETGDFTVTGNRCPRGQTYAIQELTDPRRVVTAVVPTNCHALPYLPVRTDKPLPKTLIPDLLNSLYKMRVDAPKAMGDIILENYKNTGVNVIASETL